MHREVILKVAPEALVGPGWQRHTPEVRVIQDVRVILFNTRFVRERWYSPIQGRTVTAPLPPGYDQGQYAWHVKALTLQLGHECRVTEGPLWQFLRQTGLDISQSTVSEWLSGERLLAPFHQEAAEVFTAGMAAAEWIGHDVTGTKVNGNNRACHGISDPVVSSFTTLPGQDRRETSHAFQGGKPLCTGWTR